MTEALDNLIIDAFILMLIGVIPVVLGIGLGALHNMLFPKYLGGEQKRY